MSALEALRDQRLRHKAADDALRHELHSLIRQLPANSDKRAIERASGISRTTVYRLLAEGEQQRHHSYADRRPYVVVDDLDSLRGPADSDVELPLRLDWSPKRRYNLADADDRRSLYERTLNEALHVEDLHEFLNKNLLVELWPQLLLPTQVRAVWETRFPVLASRHGAVRRTLSK